VFTLGLALLLASDAATFSLLQDAFGRPLRLLATDRTAPGAGQVEVQGHCDNKSFNPDTVESIEDES